MNMYTKQRWWQGRFFFFFSELSDDFVLCECVCVLVRERENVHGYVDTW